MIDIDDEAGFTSWEIERERKRLPETAHDESQPENVVQETSLSISGRMAIRKNVVVEIDQINWRDYKECNDKDPAIFFPPRGGDFEAAKRICRMCVVKDICLEDALKKREMFGIYGGETERGRRQILKMRRNAA